MTRYSYEAWIRVTRGQNPLLGDYGRDADFPFLIRCNFRIVDDSGVTSEAPGLQDDSEQYAYADWSGERIGT